MLAVSAGSVSSDDPLGGLVVGEHPDPHPPEGWTNVKVRAASLNHHDLWTLRGVGVDPARLPIVLGCDAAGVDSDGKEVVVHSVVASEGWSGDETLDPKRTLLSELHDGTFAQLVAVPRRNLVPKPAGLSFEEAACLPTAWLTAYRMLFSNSGVRPGGTVLVQGAGGGVASALVMLGAATGYRVWVTSRSEGKRTRALELGADRAFEPDARLPERVDAVFETVGPATWSHSLKALRPGGTLVVSGATTGFNPPAELNRVYFLQLRIVGSTMGNVQELAEVGRLCELKGLRPPIDRVLALAEARRGFEAMERGELFGKVVFVP
ncbi:MAG TPA: zinc-binding dehydrogenase [Acidimicrobiales bacterium]|nr:zinc-binding dehydrogenase [Acidimicrobiales bacterium]